LNDHGSQPFHNIDDRDVIHMPLTEFLDLTSSADFTESRDSNGDRDVPSSCVGDLSALRRCNAELAAALEEARSIDRARIAFLAMVSHELRTPLNAITGFSDAALHGIHGPLPEGYRSYFAAINGVGRHVGALVDNLLDLTQIETGRFSVELQPVSARLLIAEARAMVSAQAKRQDIEIGAPAMTEDWLLETDPVRTRQILVNLLVNAIKFTPRGGRIGIDATLVAADHLDLTVWDTGIGIAREHQEQVFEAFRQLCSRPAQNATKGVGLGLTISRQLARAMKGDLFLGSEPGKGSRFTVRLPLAQPQTCSLSEDAA
jgi:cell cycle sensor histidine kinase DivJ